MAIIKALLGVLLVTIAICGGLASVESVHASIGLVSTVTVGTYPEDVAYDSGKGEVFVAAGGALWVISDINNTVVSTIPTREGPFGVAYDSGKGEIFTANMGHVGSAFDNIYSVSVISDTTNSVVATINISGTGELGYVAYDSDKGEIFVTSINSIQPGTVTVVSDETNTIVANITVGVLPGGMVYDSGNSEIYVVNTGSDSVSVISDSTNSVVATIPVKSPGSLAYDPGTGGNGSIYVTSEGSVSIPASISVISDQTNTVTKTIVEENSTTIGEMVYDYGVGALFVTSYNYTEGISSPSILAITNGTVVATVPTPEVAVTNGVAYDFVKGEIFVAFGANSVLVISDSSAASASPSPTGSASPSPAVTPTLEPTPTPWPTQTQTLSPSASPVPSSSVPEFPTWIIVPAALAATLIAATVTQRRKLKKQSVS